VLRFYAFFEEAVPNSPLEKSRVRKYVRARGVTHHRTQPNHPPAAHAQQAAR
jgi:hypothetical protein